MCMVDFCDGAAVQQLARRKARKEYPCCECGRPIAQGEEYEHARSLFERGDDWQTHRTCRHCCAARAWLELNCNGWLFEGVLEDLIDHLEEAAWSYPAGDSFYLGRLVVGMRRRWRDGSMNLPAAPKAVDRESRRAA